MNMESNEGRKIVLEKERRIQRRKGDEYHPILLPKDACETSNIVEREKKIRRGFKQMYEKDYDWDYDR